MRAVGKSRGVAPGAGGRAGWMASTALLGLIACGNGDGSGTCSRADECGGDITGRWKVTALCARLDARALGITLDGLPAECESAVTSALGSASATPVDAMIEFTPNGQYVQTGSMRLRANYAFSSACLQTLQGSEAPLSSRELAEACAALDDPLTSTLESATCSVDVGGGCRCSVSTLLAFDSFGPYETSGGTIEFDGRSERGGYCVERGTASVQSATIGAEGRFALERLGSSRVTTDPIAGSSSGTAGTAGRAGSAGSPVIEPPTRDAGVAGASGSGGAGDAGEGSTAELDGVELSRGSSRLLDVFVGDAGIYVVLEDAVLLVDRDGTELKRVAAARPLTAAAFDAELLVVADGAKLTSYDLDLTEVVSANLVEACASAVLVSGSRFVCGPSNDWDRIYYTYDATSGELLASSSPYTYNGIPMQRVPGTDDFVTVTDDLSPSDFHLYTVLATGEAVYVSESPYHGDFRVTPVYAWNAVPPTHLVTDTGLMLLIYADGCDPAAAPGTATMGCFTKDGALGTLTGSQVFAAMDTDASGKLHAIVNPSQSFGDTCADACVLQRVDVAERTIESQTVTRFGAGQFVALRHDPASSSVVAGYALPGADPFATEPYPGYRVALFAEE